MDAGFYPVPDDQNVLFQTLKKGRPKGRPYSITERRVPLLIPVLGSQPAGDVINPAVRQACSYPRNP